MKQYTNIATFVVLMAAASISLTRAILVQPYNYMLDDSSMVNQQDGGSLSPYLNDQSGSNEHNSDKDIVSIIGDGLARIKFARNLDNSDEAVQNQGHLSQEMADLIQSEQQAQSNGKQDQQEQSLSSSVANMLLNVAQAAAQASASSAVADDGNQQQNDGTQSNTQSGDNRDVSMSSRGSIMELDTSPSSSNGATSLPSKADLKSGPIQWFNPKETIPVLKISSMATPSKYKKVYFRSEKKLVDGAFHSIPNSEQNEKKSLMKTFNSGVQRRSSRGTSSSVAPPSILQDGVIDFLRKFRDVYIQTRPVSTASGSSASSLASNVVAAAASSPFAAVLSPSSSSGSRPNLASALSAATSMVNNAAMVAQAASSGGSSQSSSSGGSASSVAGAAAAGAAGNPNKSSLTAQSYVSFWSKTFPTWVRKMLKQLRRRSLYNSNKRQQQHHNHHHHGHSSSIGQAAQAAASGAVASAVESAVNSVTNNSGSSSSSSSSSSS